MAVARPLPHIRSRNSCFANESWRGTAHKAGEGARGTECGLSLIFASPVILTPSAFGLESELSSDGNSAAAAPPAAFDTNH